jgi:hypothetical protein
MGAVATFVDAQNVRNKHAIDRHKQRAKKKSVLRAKTIKKES